MTSQTWQYTNIISGVPSLTVEFASGQPIQWKAADNSIITSQHSYLNIWWLPLDLNELAIGGDDPTREMGVLYTMRSNPEFEPAAVVTSSSPSSQPPTTTKKRRVPGNQHSAALTNYINFQYDKLYGTRTEDVADRNPANDPLEFLYSRFSFPNVETIIDRFEFQDAVAVAIPWVPLDKVA